MSVASNDNEVSLNASAADRSHENYHLDNFHILKKIGGQVMCLTSPQEILHL
jgi:hypothetical protein